MITDIHTHIVPAAFPSILGGATSAIELRPTCDCGRAEVFVDGKQFRTITSECWNVDRRIERMDAIGIGRQVLSPMPELLSYWRPASEAAAIADHVNAQIGEMIARQPHRFVGLGMVPLQNPDLAVAMLERLMAEPGFRGVEIGTNIDGRSLGDDALRPFFAASERLGASILVHPVKPVVGYPVAGMPAMRAFAEFPCETALAAASLIAGGVISAHPGLRIAFCHGGGALAMLLPRLDHGWRTTAAISAMIGEMPSALARRLFYDTLVYDPSTLAFLIHSFGKTQLCIGTDQPFAIAEGDPIGQINRLGLDAADRDLLLSSNAARFLGEVVV